MTKAILCQMLLEKFNAQIQAEYGLVGRGMIEAFYIDKSVATNFLKISMLAIAAICDCFYLRVFSNSKLQ